MAISISLVALSKSAKIAGGEIPKAWARRWPQGPQPGGLEKKENTLSFDVGEHQVIYGLMPAPIPWSDLEGPCTHAVFWPEAAEAMRQHQRHVIVTASGEGSRTELMKVLTQATIALSDACQGTTGVYWVNSAHVLPPDRFAEIACQFLPAGPPLPLWVNFIVGQGPDGKSIGFTKGLRSFDLMEFETRNATDSPEELRDRLLNMAAYVLEKGPVINDGDTVGASASEKISVRYEPSSFGGEGTVMRLDYSTAEAGGTRMTAYGCIHALATLLCTIAFAWLLYSYFPILRGNFLRHFLILPIVLVFGFFLLVISDRILQKAFGLEAFDTGKK